MPNQERAKPAAWAITHNRELWPHFDPIADDFFVIGWSLADNYRARQMAPGDRAVFWMTGDEGGVARVGFVLDVRESPGGSWTDPSGHRHEAPYHGEFFMPPLPRRTYLHRSALEHYQAFRDCELVRPGVSSSQPPLRIENDEWEVIEKVLRRLSERLETPDGYT